MWNVFAAGKLGRETTSENLDMDLPQEMTQMVRVQKLNITVVSMFNDFPVDASMTNFHAIGHW